jgi:hypothetical protein
MQLENRKNCNTCKFNISCETLACNEEYQKISGSFIDGFAKRRKFRENFICDNHKSPYIEYPIEVSKINIDNQVTGLRDKSIGRFVSIRPCAKEYQNKTYLGIYLGDLPTSNHVTHNDETKELNISFTTNPAILVFDLKKIVYGYESWWRLIESEEDLKQITDTDIDNVWYMKVLKEVNTDGN